MDDSLPFSLDQTPFRWKTDPKEPCSVYEVVIYLNASPISVFAFQDHEWRKIKFSSFTPPDISLIGKLSFRAVGLNRTKIFNPSGDCYLTFIEDTLTISSNWAISEDSAFNISIPTQSIVYGNSGKL